MSNYADQQQIPGTLKLLAGGSTNESMNGNAFTIAFVNEESNIVFKPASGGDETISITALAGTSVPVNAKEIVSTSGAIVIGY